MATPQDFVDACHTASDALASLSDKCDALLGGDVGGFHFGFATDDEDVNIAQQGKKFATVAGPKSLGRAIDNQDANELALLQRGIKGVTTDVTDALTTDAIERFLLLPIAPLLALAPAEILDVAREDLASIPAPPGFDPRTGGLTIPYPVFVGAGAVGGALASLAMTGNPKAAIGGALAGGALGALARYGLGRLSSFSIFGSNS